MARLVLPDYGHVPLWWFLTAWSGRWDAVLSGPVRPRNKGHGQGAHPWPHLIPPLLLKDGQRLFARTLWCDGAIQSHMSYSSQPRGCALHGQTWVSLTSQPRHGHSAAEHPTILLLRCNPACCGDAKLIKTLLHYEGRIHSCACSDACDESPTTSKALRLRLHKLTWFQLCLARSSL